MVSVTDLHKLLSDYLSNKIERSEFSRRFLDSYANPVGLKDAATFELSVEVHFHLALSLLGLRTEQELREALLAIPIATYEVHIAERDKGHAEPVLRLDKSRAYSRESSVEVAFV